jgi:uncharacterized protein (TIGR03067 family)
MKNFAIVMAIGIIWMAAPVSAQTIDGDWSVTDGEYAGDKVPQSALDEMSLKLSRNTFDAKSGDVTSKGKITNQSRSRPPQLIFKIDTGNDAGREIKAIYEMTGEVLKIAFSMNGEFPEDFSSNADNNNLVLTYKNNNPATASRQAPRGRGGRRRPITALPEGEIVGSNGQSATGGKK